MDVSKFFIVFVINLLISSPTFARAVEKKDVHFEVDTTSLMKGEVHYALDVVSVAKLSQKYGEFYGLDSMAFIQEPKIKVVVSKSAYIVSRPVGFFDQENMVSESFISHYMGEQKVKKLPNSDYKITVPGKEGYSYKMKTYFDSDEVSTLPNSKVVRAVTQIKKLDVISQSASSTIFREYRDFSKYSVGGAQVSTIIPLKENKTLVITYSLTAVKKFYALKDLIKSNFKDEAESQMKLIESYKAN